MKQWLRMTATLGAALVFSCTGASQGDQIELGTAHEALENCANMGYTVEFPGGHPVMSFHMCYEAGAVPPYDCALPKWFGDPAQPVYWTYDPSQTIGACPGQVSHPNYNIMGQSGAMTEAFNAWSAASGLNFQFTSIAAQANIIVSCLPTPFAGDTSLAATGPSGDFDGPGSINKWSSGPFGPITPPPGATEPVYSLFYHQAHIVVHDEHIATKIDQCSGTATQKATKARNLVRYLMAHEIGHALSFGDYPDGTGGVMDAHMDPCSAPSTISIAQRYKDAMRVIRNGFYSPEAYPDESGCTLPPSLSNGKTWGSLQVPGGTPEAARLDTIRSMYAVGAWDSRGGSDYISGPAVSPVGFTGTPALPIEPGPPQFKGTSAKYTSNMTYGIQTGAPYKSCNWSSSSQICALPKSYVIDWCFGANVTDNNFKNDFRTYTQLTAPQGQWNVPSMFAGAVFRYHNSCNDPGVNLVVDNAACSGTNSANIDGYVCLSIPPLVTALEVINNTPWPSPGTYYNWQAQPNGWMTLHIDAGDMLNSIPNSTNRTGLFAHAARIGVQWVLGIGTRTDVTNLTSSRAVVPYWKDVNHAENTACSPVPCQVETYLSDGEYCRLQSLSWPVNALPFFADEYQLAGYCGAD